DYKFSEVSNEGRATFETTKGAFRAITGAIQKQEKSSYMVKTPLAVIGVRGTDFWGGFIFGDQLDVTVLSGKGVYVESSEGRVLLNIEEGTTVKANQLAPSEPKVWPKQKLEKAVASVTLD
ncbi:MAG: FecR family protein, partial [Pseudomonadales bacterium]|nr:FecR family protein [Pseudomonadales bacterium]